MPTKPRAGAGGGAVQRRRRRRRHGAVARRPAGGHAGGRPRRPLADAGWRDASTAPVLLEGTPFRVLAARRGGAAADVEDVFPPEAEVFNAFNATPLADVRVVPRPGPVPRARPGARHWSLLAAAEREPPPSLKNIYKELATDLPRGGEADHGNLQSWAEQGVFLLNASLSVRQGEANSHAKLGWQEFTDEVIKVLNRQPQKIVFILWGGFAQKKACRLNEAKHCVLARGAPVAALGDQVPRREVFSRANAFLAKEGKEEVDWRVPA